MNQRRTIDQDDVLRARTLLLGSGRRTPQQEVDAHRVLAQVNPAVHLPRLVRALHRLSYDTAGGRPHPDSLELCAEALAAARAVDPADPARPDLLYRALDRYQRELYAAGRRAEGLAVRAELPVAGREWAARSGRPEGRGLREWAAGLAEEGRWAEAAEALAKYVAALPPEGDPYSSPAGVLLEQAAVLAEAGRAEEALRASVRTVDVRAAEAEQDRGPFVHLLYALIGHARLLDAFGRTAPAAAARQRALAVLTELAATGERKSWSGGQASCWVTVLRCSDAEAERADGGPRPPVGAEYSAWSPDIRRRYLDGLARLEEETAALAARAAEDPDRHLAALVRLHRSRTVRAAVHHQHRTHLFGPPLRPLFDEGVRLAERLARHDPPLGRPALATALVDRSTLHAATGEFAPALEDFRRALRTGAGTD